jgi:hypothetical protein
MKINIWIKKDEAVSGKITEYHCHIPQVSYGNYVQVVVSQDEFAKLEDSKKISIHDLNDMSMKSDNSDFLVEQYNRNREVKDQVVSKEQIPYIYERNPDTDEIFRHRAGDVHSARELVEDFKKEKAIQTVGERDYSGEKGLDELVTKMKNVTGGDFNGWFHKLTKNEQSKLQTLFKK